MGVCSIGSAASMSPPRHNQLRGRSPLVSASRRQRDATGEHESPVAAADDLARASKDNSGSGSLGPLSYSGGRTAIESVQAGPRPHWGLAGAGPLEPTGL